MVGAPTFDVVIILDREARHGKTFEVLGAKGGARDQAARSRGAARPFASSTRCRTAACLTSRERAPTTVNNLG